VQVRGYELTRDLFHDRSVVPNLANTCNARCIVQRRDGDLVQELLSGGGGWTRTTLALVESVSYRFGKWLERQEWLE